MNLIILFLLLIGSEVSRLILESNYRYLIISLSFSFPLIIVSNTMEQDFNFTSFPSVIGLALISLIYVTKNKSHLSQYSTAIFFTLISVPLLILGPTNLLIHDSEFRDSVSYGLLALSALIFLIFLLIALLFLIRTRKIKLCALSSNYLEEGHWFGSVCFLLGQGILCMLFFK